MPAKGKIVSKTPVMALLTGLGAALLVVAAGAALITLGVFPIDAVRFWIGAAWAVGGFLSGRCTAAGRRRRLLMSLLGAGLILCAAWGTGLVLPGEWQGGASALRCLLPALAGAVMGAAMSERKRRTKRKQRNR